MSAMLSAKNMIHGGKRWKCFWLHIAVVELVLFPTYGIICCPRDIVYFMTDIIVQMASLTGADQNFDRLWSHVFASFNYYDVIEYILLTIY